MSHVSYSTWYALGTKDDADWPECMHVLHIVNLVELQKQPKDFEHQRSAIEVRVRVKRNLAVFDLSAGKDGNIREEGEGLY